MRILFLLTSGNRVPSACPVSDFIPWPHSCREWVTAKDDGSFELSAEVRFLSLARLPSQPDAEAAGSQSAPRRGGHSPVRHRVYRSRGFRQSDVQLRISVPEAGMSCMVLDLDDAVFLRYPEKFERLVPMADLLVAGNHPLRDRFAGVQRQIFLMPTCIDLDIYRPPQSTRR